MWDLHHTPLFVSQPAAGLHLRLTLPLVSRGVLLFQLMSHMVGRVGFEPTYPEGKRFTVSPL